MVEWQSVELEFFFWVGLWIVGYGGGGGGEGGEGGEGVGELVW